MIKIRLLSTILLLGLVFFRFNPITPEFNTPRSNFCFGFNPIITRDSPRVLFWLPSPLQMGVVSRLHVSMIKVCLEGKGRHLQNGCLTTQKTSRPRNLNFPTRMVLLMFLPVGIVLLRLMF